MLDIRWLSSVHTPTVRLTVASDLNCGDPICLDPLTGGLRQHPVSTGLFEWECLFVESGETVSGGSMCCQCFFRNLPDMLDWTTVGGCEWVGFPCEVKTIGYEFHLSTPHV